MKKRWLILILIFGIFASSFVFGNEKVSNEINPTVEKVKVNVLLNENISEKRIGLMSSEKRINDLKFRKNTRDFHSSNGFSTELTYSEIIELSKNPHVQFISKVRNFSISLVEAVSITNASSVWETQIGNTNLTGKGQSVCILDTGINYSHPDLAQNYLGGWNFIADDNDTMDDNGHGTHVAGIVAANGSLKGIAPDAGIVAIKVLNSVGTGNDADIISGIEWCVANASVYNISVISMSLGTSCPGPYCYDNYCDSNPNETLMINAINAAVAQNISVIVASGNDANYTHISSPACASNATPVGDTYDGNVSGLCWGGSGCGDATCIDATTFLDKIVCHANRNFMVGLFAPGAMINSTWFNGSYEEAGGTSMATPMVAGAFALINQKLNLIGETRTPVEIETIFNNTGVVLEDSESGLNFSRIDIFSAIESINYTLLSIEILSPENATSININETNFSCSSSSTTNNLTNLTFYLYNSTELIFNETRNLEGLENNETFNYTFSEEDDYLWSCFVMNNQSENASTENYSITYDVSYPEVSNVSSSVSYNSATLAWNTSEETNVSIVSNSNVTNSTYSINHSEIISSLTASIGYSYNLTFCDRAGNCNSTNGSFTTSAAPVVRSSSSSGGGGGSSVKAYDVDLTDPSSNPTAKSLAKADKIKFSSYGENHTLTLNKIINNQANITVQSEPINFVLIIGEVKKLNLSSAEYFDVEIKLENISLAKAKISIRAINESIIPVENRFRIQNESSDESSPNDPINNGADKIVLSLIISFIVLVLWVWFVVVILNKTNQKRLKTKTANKNDEKTKTKTKRKR